LDELVDESGVARSQLIAEIKAVHQSHRTSEYAFLIEELPSLRGRYPAAALPKIYSKAIRRYRRVREHALLLYPGVQETLQNVRSAGAIVVAYTESMALYTNFRMKHLNLDPLVCYLYSPTNHDLPENVDAHTLSLFPARPYDLVHAEHRYTPPGFAKPSTVVLEGILRDIDAVPSQCVYVGDSLMKDIAMANDVGMTSIHAAYGESHRREQYELLKAVTHWSAADVEKEKSYKPGIASHTIHSSYAEFSIPWIFAPINIASR
jgi:phosphoglycolate phosphatase